MTEPTRAKTGRRNKRSASQLFMAALVVFGVVASVLLLFSENVQWLRVGVASALWAAIIGAFAMTKYRRESTVDQAKAKDLQTVYELQLAREISARREYELGVEAKVREQTKLEVGEIAALRTELAALRSNLQVLFEGNLPTERIALRAEAVRMQELAGRSYDSFQPAPSGLYVPGGGPAGPGEPVDYVQPGPVRDTGIATPYDEPVTAETSVIYPETAQPTVRANASAETTQTFRRVESERATEPSDRGGARRPTPFSGYNYGESRPPRASAESTVPTPPEPSPLPEPAPLPVEPQPADPQPVDPQPVDPQPKPVPEPEPQPTPVPEPLLNAQSTSGSFGESLQRSSFFRDGSSDQFTDAASAPKQSAAEQSAAEQSTPEESAESDAPTPRRRRRAEDSEPLSASGAHSNGRSVADILAGLQSGGAEPSARRHRRRAD